MTNITKFRARRIDNNRWVYGNYFQSPLTDENSGTTLDKGWFFLSDGIKRHCIEQDNVCFVIDKLTIGQFTGQFDKNEKEIYEGDIMAYLRKDGIEIVKGYVNFERTGYKLIREELNTSWPLQGYAKRHYIIGNIYDNRELLSIIGSGDN